jgi:hypothetical protein
VETPDERTVVMRMSEPYGPLLETILQLLADRGIRASADELLITTGSQQGLDLAGLSAHLGAEVSEVSAGRYSVHAASTPQVVAEVTRWLAEQDIAVGVLRAGRETLEEAFLRRLVEGTQEHVARRRDEMRAAVGLLEELGVTPTMTAATLRTLETSDGECLRDLIPPTSPADRGPGHP